MASVSWPTHFWLEKLRPVVPSTALPNGELDSEMGSIEMPLAGLDSLFTDARFMC